MRWDGWRGQLEQLLGGADGGGSRVRHAEHARLGLETAFREDARALRARLHPFGRSRLELGYRGAADDGPVLALELRAWAPRRRPCRAAALRARQLPQLYRVAPPCGPLQLRVALRHAPAQRVEGVR